MTDLGNIACNYSRKKILITGGAGFIGGNLARRLIALGAEVSIADCFLTDHGGNLKNLEGIENIVRLHRTDIRDKQAIEPLIKGQDYIFNLAAQTFHIDSMTDPFTDHEINCRSQLNLLEACRLYNPDVKIILASTRQVYGKPLYSPIDENHPLNPVDINGIHKIAAEHYHLLYYHSYNIRTVILRLTNTYGPCQILKHSRANFTGWLIRQAIEQSKISIFGDGSQSRDLTYIDDAVEAFLLCGLSDTADGEIFNLGGDKPHTLREFTETLLKVCPGSLYQLVPFPDDRKRIDIGSVLLSYEKIRKYLGWSPVVSLEDGLARTVSYYKNNREYYW